MDPAPVYDRADFRGSGKLEGKVALITGGDSGIGRSVSVLFAREGADVAIVYLDEHEDAQYTSKLVGNEGRRCLLVPGDIADEDFCARAVDQTVSEFGRLDVLVNHAAEQHPQPDLTGVSAAQLERTFRTNVFSMFYLTKAALPHLREGSAIVNTASVTAYKGNPSLIDYTATNGAVVSFTRALAQSLAPNGVRVNAVAPGPIWTPLIPASFPPDAVARFGADTPMGRPGQPVEVATSYVFLASQDASYFSGQVLHPNGGDVVNG